ncbi:MAG: endo-1,4-beta-xylanase [Lachnospiraceae bacterium]|nr:endo-1,4-beta-xylanase [Lachnospiraceae bacterium]
MMIGHMKRKLKNWEKWKMDYKRIKTIAAISAAILSMGLAGCGESASSAKDGVDSTKEQTVLTSEEVGRSQVQKEDTASQTGNAESQSENTEGQTNNTEGQSGNENGNAGENSEKDIALKDACSKYFMLGVGINGSTLENLTTYDDEYMAMVKKHFNSVTLSNLMKSSYILQQKASQESADGMPVLDFSTIDDTLQWCMDNGVKMRGHTLVWHTQAPEWFFCEGYKDDGKYVDKETMLARMESYIKQMLEHVQTNYPGVIYCWDVVNEAVDPGSGDKESGFLCRTEFDGGPNPWYETIGPEYVEAAFRFARQYADPEVKLIYNDFNTYETQKRNAIYALCENLKTKGLIDGIGMQGYWGIDYPNITAITSAITIYSRLELEIQITELSVGVDEETPEEFEKQAKRYRNIFLNLKALDTQGGGNCNITSVTFFGLKDHYTPGDKTNARLFDKDLNPKPAFDAVLQIFQMLYKD